MCFRGLQYTSKLATPTFTLAQRSLGMVHTNNGVARQLPCCLSMCNTQPLVFLTTACRRTH
jgi:hypothetical protein